MSETDDEKAKRQGLTYDQGKKWPASALLALPFIFILIPMIRAARYEVNWKALIAMVLTFEVVMFLAEAFSVSRGHWVWNQSRIFGYRIWNVPIEEPLIYYWLGPVFVVVLFHTLLKRFKK